MKEHNSGYTKSTKPYGPWKLIYSEVCESRSEARKREKYWKAGSEKEKLKKLLNSQLDTNNPSDQTRNSSQT
ncbi:MAG: GIY-YIG nuclease family protein [Bacteroidales bacterium]|nr:GIY-YIG nuclease family protein [Bacteroidales bacterium]